MGIDHASSSRRRRGPSGGLGQRLERLRGLRDARVRGGWIACAALALLMLLVLLPQGPLGDLLWPQARAQELEARGADALARGHLTAADGSGARELYEAALAMDPDRIEARTGLARVASAALAQARGDLARDRLDEAHRHLELARALSVPRGQADAVATRLREREAALAGLDGLIARADEAMAQGLLDGDDASALALYARVLALQPAHAQALRGREDALGILLEQAREQLRRGELAAAAAAIGAARRYDPGHVDLPDTQARLTEELDALRRRADADLRRGRTDAAVAAWRQLQALDPDDAAAKAGLYRAGEAQAAQATRLAADFRFEAATRALEAARDLAPGSPAVASAEAAMQRAQRSRQRLQTPASRGERARRLPELLRQAAEAEARGDLLSPPGDSAYDRLRAAQALAPRDAQVRRAIARLLPSARACFDRGLRANNLAQARRCLDASDTLGEEPRALAAARRRLALRWLAIGDERLSAGELQPASAALAAAREADAAVPGLDDFDRRLQVASGARR